MTGFNDSMAFAGDISLAYIPDTDPPVPLEFEVLQRTAGAPWYVRSLGDDWLERGDFATEAEATAYMEENRLARQPQEVRDWLASHPGTTLQMLRDRRAGDAAPGVGRAAARADDVERQLVDAILARYHKTRLSPDAAGFILQGFAVRTALAALAATQPREPDEWRTIDSAPRDGSYVLAYGPHDTRRSYIDVVHYFRGRWTITWMDGYGDPTHWRPLPAPQVQP